MGNKSQTSVKKKGKPEKCISIEEAKELQKTWCDTRTHEIHKCVGFEDSRQFWWSVEELEEYLKYVKKKSKKQGILNPGIRFFFGAYPKSKCNAGQGHSTLFLAPTGAVPKNLGKGDDSNEEEEEENPNNYEIEPFNRGNDDKPKKDY